MKHAGQGKLCAGKGDAGKGKRGAVTGDAGKGKGGHSKRTYWAEEDGYWCQIAFDEDDINVDWTDAVYFGKAASAADAYMY